MRHNLSIWIVSGLVSLGAHAGVMSALAKINFEAPVTETLAEVVLAGSSIAPVTAAAVPAQAASELSASNTGQVLNSDGGALASEPSQDQAADSTAPDAVSAAAASATASDAPALVESSGQAETADAGVEVPAAPDTAEASETPSIAVASARPAASQPEAPAASASVPHAADGAAAIAGESAPSVAMAAPSGVAAAATDAPGSQPAAALAAEDGGAVLPSSSDQASATPPLPAGTKTASVVTAVPEVVSQAEKIDRFLAGYKGSGCLYARPRVLDAARPSFSGFGGERGVSDFAAAFRQAVGIAPELAIAKVMDAQCPAVDFIRDITAAAPKQIDVVLDAEVLTSGGMITGHLGGDPGGAVRLLVIGDDGAVNDISADFHRIGPKNFFASPLIVNDEGRDRNQIIVALVSEQPLSVAVEHKPGEAKVLFEDIASQAKAPGASVAIGFNAFRVQ